MRQAERKCALYCDCARTTTDGYCCGAAGEVPSSVAPSPGVLPDDEGANCGAEEKPEGLDVEPWLDRERLSGLICL